MRFVSTRGIKGKTFEECISSGYAPDGGLYMPETIPQITTSQLTRWKGLPFQGVAFQVLKLFVGDEIDDSQLRNLVNESYATWGDKRILPLIPIDSVAQSLPGNVRGKFRLYSAELFHGPSLSFKDFGQQILCKLLDYFCRKRRRSTTVVVSTTGDTGPAAISAVSNTSLRIICFYPKGQVSRFQEQQMTTMGAAHNISIIPFEGGGDDMDAPIKSVTTNPGITSQISLCSVNSINVGRIVAQTIHYFWVYLRTMSRGEIERRKRLVVSIPTGAMGNVTAGILSMHMGLPIGRFVCGVNDNDILHRAVTTGVFRKLPMRRTLSEAINIQVPYNFERVLYLLSNGANQSRTMQTLERTGAITMPWHQLIKLRSWVKSSKVPDKLMLSTIKSLWASQRYLIDPHGAVGVCAALLNARGVINELKQDDTPIACLSTAHVCKFKEAIVEAYSQSFWDSVKKSVMPVSALALESKREVTADYFTRPKTGRGGADNDSKRNAIWTKRLENILLAGRSAPAASSKL